jgi:uncharacterized sulfatase
VHSPVQAPPDMRGDGSPAANYVGVMEEMDRQLARVFDLIRSQEQLRKNTIVLLCSDNGPEAGLGLSEPLRGSKGMLYEGGIRSPLIVWSSQIDVAKAGSGNARTVIAAIDFAPSLLKIAGIATDAKFDGVDMSDPMLGRTSPDRDTPVMWVRPPDRPGPKKSWPDLAIRENQWKLLVFRDGSKPELFDLSADESEKHNLASEHPDLVQKLSREVIDWDNSIAGGH